MLKLLNTLFGAAAPKRQEFRIAVGSPSGERSTVWKFWTNGADVYIQSRMFGSDCKVSLHASGQCQFSRTSESLKKISPDAKNQERHINKWRSPRPIGLAAARVFCVRIPASELRTSAVAEDLKNVHWIPSPGPGKMVALECYITPVVANDPALTGGLPPKCDHIVSMRLTDGRWFLILMWTPRASSKVLSQVRTLARGQAAGAGLSLTGSWRLAALGEDDGVRYLAEVCAV